MFNLRKSIDLPIWLFVYFNTAEFLEIIYQIKQNKLFQGTFILTSHDSTVLSYKYLKHTYLAVKSSVTCHDAAAVTALSKYLVS